MSTPAKPIKFYHKGEENYGLTNFAPASFAIHKIPPNLGLSPHLTGTWKTSEHLFQAAKFNDQAIIEEIRQATTAREVFDLANSTSGTYRGQIREDWDDDNIKLGIMKWVVKEKFTQNEKLKTKLLNTGDAELIEDTENDTRNASEPWKKDQYWGNATKYDRRTRICLNIPGDNHLGKILMEIRQELTSNPTPPPQFPNDIPPVPKPSEKENLKNLIKASNGWEEWNNNYQKVSSFNFQEQEELAEELLNSLANIINKSNDLTTLNNLQSNWRNHQFYTQNSGRAVKINQFYNNRRQEIEQKTTSSSSSQPKNNFLTDHWQIILIVFLAFVISIAFIQRRKKVNLKK